MCALHDGQIVDVALPQTCCFRLHSKHYVRAARRTDCGRGATTNLLFPFAFETLDNRAVLSFPKILKFAEDGRAGWRSSRRFFADPQL